MSEDVMGDEWDLSEVLTERKQPTAEVDVYLNEFASHAKASLVEHMTSAKLSSEEHLKLEAEVEVLDAEIESKHYVITVAAIPSRMQEDIQSEAFHEFPIKVDFIGRDDAQNQIDRTKHQNLAIWHAQIKNVVNPAGQSKRSWTLEEVDRLRSALPVQARTAVDDAIKDINEKAEQYTTKSKNVDFS